MRFSLALSAALVPLAAVLAGCPTGVTPTGPSSGCDPADPTCLPCVLDADCPNGGVCNAGVCGEGLPVRGGDGGDSGANTGGDCSQTSECPADQMCNGASRTCEDLPAGWCRAPTDCGGGTPNCTAQSSNVPGICVECLDDSDCEAGGRCGGGGVCAGGQTQPCPANSTRTGSTCTCNDGFHLDATTHTCESDTPAAGCVDHAHPVPGQAGRCECDTGFVPSPTGNACVRPEANPGAGGGGDPGSEPGTEGSGDSIIGNCGPNTIAIYFICFCLPGFEPNPNGDVGCEEPLDGGSDPGSDPGTSDPGASDPGATVPGSGDACVDNGWYGDGVCDSFCASPDPDCDAGAPPPGDATTSDVCADNSWYNDGICDDFCPSPDPDCDTGGGSTGTSDVCAANGWYGDGVCDDFCASPDPDCAASDVCADNGWYGDMVCDDFCAQPDPDCDDVCAQNDWYGDGACDTFCPLADPDC